MPATVPLWEPACRRRYLPLPPRPQSLPWQLPQIQALPPPAIQSRASKLQDWPRGSDLAVGAGMPATAPSATAATPVAAMAAPTDSSAPSPAIQSRASKLQDWPRGSDLAVGAGMPATAPLWEPACRRRYPCGSRHAGDGTLVGAGMPATVPSATAATPVAAMTAPTDSSAATASHSIACFETARLAARQRSRCGSRPAGDGTLVGAGMPATVPPATAATPVAAMAAPTDSSAATASYSIACFETAILAARQRSRCGSRHAGDRATADRHGRCRFGFRAAAYRIATLGRAGPQTMSWRTTSSVWSSTPLSAS